MATSPRGYLLHSTQAAFGGPGLSHTLSEYLGGVALAHRFNMCLVYEPILCGHGLHDAFERLLWGVGDEYRGIPPPLCAPRVSFSADARSASMNGGKLMRVVEIAGKRPDSRDLSNDEIAARLATVPNGSLVVLRKVQAFHSRSISAVMGSECRSAGRPYHYVGLWVRERYWRAVHRMHELAPRWRDPQHARPPWLPSFLAKGQNSLPSPWEAHPQAGRAKRASVPSARHSKLLDEQFSKHSVRLCVHVRRGDIAKQKNRHGARAWVDIGTVLSSLRTIRKVIELPLRAPHVQVVILTEVGFTGEEERQVRSVAPDADFHRDGTAKGTLEALTLMAHSDLLVMGTLDGLDSATSGRHPGLLSCSPWCPPLAVA